MSTHNLRALIIAKRNIKQLPNCIKILEKSKKDLQPHRNFFHVDLICENIDEALEELGYIYLQAQTVIKDKGKIG